MQVTGVAMVDVLGKLNGQGMQVTGVAMVDVLGKLNGQGMQVTGVAMVDVLGKSDEDFGGTEFWSFGLPKNWRVSLQ
jgi:hypothetical protein